jgi:hypothetical protein
MVQVCLRAIGLQGDAVAARMEVFQTRLFVALPMKDSGLTEDQREATGRWVQHEREPHRLNTP